MVISPELRFLRPIMHSMVVVLPAPFGPRMPNTEPSSTRNETESTAFKGLLGEPYSLDNADTVITSKRNTPLII